jgi:hypothetical protein
MTALLLSPAAPAKAEPQASALRLVYSNMVAARLNPLGLQEQLSVGYRYRLFASDSPLLASSHVAALFEPRLTPTDGTLGAALEIEPLALLRLRLVYRYVNYFGSFGSMQQFSDAASDYGDSGRSRRAKAGETTAKSGSQVAIDALLQAAVGPFAIRNQLVAERYAYRLDGGAAAFYDPTYDMLVPGHGWLFNDNVDALVRQGGVVAGVRYTITHARPDWPASSAAGTGNTPIQRVGPLFAYTFFKEPGSRFDEPTLLLVMNWWLRHRFRTGEDVSQAMPFVILGFACKGDLG